MKTIDMSEKAILRRLKQVDQLRDLCLSLMKAKPLSANEAEELRAKMQAKRLKSNLESNDSANSPAS